MSSSPSSKIQARKYTIVEVLHYSKIVNDLDWKMGSRGSLQCKICNDNIWRDRRSANIHEQTGRHRKAVARLEARGDENSTGGRNRALLQGTSSDSSSSSGPVEQLPPNKDRRTPTPLTNAGQNVVQRSISHIRDVYLHNKEKEWFPWPDKIVSLYSLLYLSVLKVSVGMPP